MNALVSASSFTMVGAIASAIPMVLNAFKKKKPGADPLMAAIAAIRRDIAELREHLDRRLDYIDSVLSQIFDTIIDVYKSLNTQLGTIDASLDELHEKVRTVETRVSQAEANIWRFISDASRGDLHREMNTVLHYRENFGIDLPYPRFIEGEGIFITHATVTALTTTATGPPPADRSIDDDKVYEELTRYPLLDANLGWLNRYMTERLGLPPFTAVPLPGTTDWALAARAYEQAGRDWPAHLSRVNPNRLADVKRIGQRLQTASAKLVAPDPDNERPYFDGAITNYRDKRDNYFATLTNTESAAITIHQPAGLDIWKGHSQTPTKTPAAPTTLGPCSNGVPTSAGGLHPLPSNITVDSMFDNVHRNAALAGIAILGYCYELNWHSPQPASWQWTPVPKWHWTPYQPPPSARCDTDDGCYLAHALYIDFTWTARRVLTIRSAIRRNGEWTAVRSRRATSDANAICQVHETGRFLWYYDNGPAHPVYGESDGGAGYRKVPAPGPPSAGGTCGEHWWIPVTGYEWGTSPWRSVNVAEQWTSLLSMFEARAEPSVADGSNEPIEQVVSASLRSGQRNVYRSLASAHTDPAHPFFALVQNRTLELDGSAKLLESLTAFALSGQIERDELLQGLLRGSDRLIDNAVEQRVRAFFLRLATPCTAALQPPLCVPDDELPDHSGSLDLKAIAAERIDLLDELLQTYWEQADEDGIDLSSNAAVADTLARLDEVGAMARTPLVSTDAARLIFDQTPAGQTTAGSVKVTNVSLGMPLTITSVSVTGTGASSFQATDNCPDIVAPAATCDVTVRYRAAEAGAHEAALEIHTSARGGTLEIPLRASASASDPVIPPVDPAPQDPAPPAVLPPGTPTVPKPLDTVPPVKPPAAIRGPQITKLTMDRRVIRYTLSRRARVRLTVARGRECTARSSCRRYVNVATVTISGQAGQNRHARARHRKLRRLAAGTYRLTATATATDAAGRRGPTVTARIALTR